jgi:nucleoside-diphosphate-sugar epimerase
MERFLVTGGLGCIGAWTVRELRASGVEVVVGDLGGSRHRLANLGVVGDDGVVEVPLDITDPIAVCACFEQYQPTHVIHLAALQVPFCKADPIGGALVNVVGTVALMEAMVEYLPQRTFTYASSIAAYGDDDEPTVDGIAEASPHGKPRTLYGVYKRANEDSAAVYQRDRGLASIGLRPYIVYGVGRDQGVTSTPTAAMLAAATGESCHISFGGRAVYHHARDAARAFIAAARSDAGGAHVVNLPGDEVAMSDVVAAILRVVPSARITFDDIQLPFPPSVDLSEYASVVGSLDRYALVDGVEETIERFRLIASEAPLGDDGPTRTG